MKFLLLLLFVLQTQSLEEIHECILGIRTYPFRYVGSTQTVELKVEFKSNCLEFASMNFFVLPYNKDFELTADQHPKRVIISLFGKAYQLDFSEPKKQPKTNPPNVIYSKVRISPSGIPNRIGTESENNILLRTSENNSFKKEDIENIFYVKNPCLCELESSKQTLFCKIG